MLGLSLVCAVPVAAVLGAAVQACCQHGAVAATAVGGLWTGFALFCLGFFRDPDPALNAPPDAWLSPAHGVVDIIDEVTESEFMAGCCRRISIFLSVFDVHVQNAPVSGRVVYHRHHAGEFLNALRLESAARNENVLLGFEAGGRPDQRVAVRLIAGLIARRIVSWVAQGDVVDRGERISLIQFGSRVELYLPLTARVQVGLGDRVRGGVTVLALPG